ncbi:PhaM family polyhydroxyalkanoate granule multifunctional regulatory protein [Rhodoferax sp. UBA5149]|uniref:PhaM family polyhydroxyalkanoate granule multifunctional regulatory protein n=1 Tax=Rhodoferax sp. UBA5149 TaxID=1947379 RepID=UPI0025EAB81F|nr:PhaM family polyhydroxyalkanoate granule multifunctional regulatory protein [Rhodoferax sp. UBA5149]
MSDSQSTGFGKFVPGFDFLQNLAKGASETIPQMPNLANWIAPTMNVEELEKRIAELKAVHFWLDQNSKALGATVQALEVQKMTLATLKGMNFNIGDVANAFKLKAADAVASSVQKVTEKAASAAQTISEVAADAGDMAKSVRQAAKPATTAAAGLVDPMQLWNSLTQQFQQIAASAMKDVGKNTARDVTKNMAAGFAKEAVKATKKAASKAVKSRAAAKKTVKKPTSRNG